MTRVLLTGGTGFIAAHILDTLLKHGHSVVATVRTHEKGQWILDKHSGYDKRQLDYAVVPDISQPGAYDSAVVSSPPFEAVIHAASPYHFNAKTEAEIDDLITTAINGTTGILQAVKAKAPSVRRMVVISSFAAIVDPNKPVTYTYSEKDWDPITREEASTGGGLTAYRCSKTLAERAAWDFIEKEKPNFTLTTCNPPLVLGPVIHPLPSLSQINTSNIRLRDLLTGTSKSKLPPTGNHLWVDVRDLALAHVSAIEKPDTANKRFFITKGNFCNREIVDVVRKAFPKYEERMPEGEALKSGDWPEAGVHGWDNRQSIEVLGVQYRSFEECIVDTVHSLLPFLEREGVAVK